MQTLISLPLIALAAVTATQLFTAFISSKLTIIPQLRHFFTSFAVGALLGNAFVHILPITFIYNPEPMFISTMMLLGVLLNFFSEKIVRMYNYYTSQEAQNKKAIRINHFISDLMHSAITGSTIVAAYLQSSSLGISTSIALGLISITQILSTMNIMTHHGIAINETLKSLIITSLATIITGVSIHHYQISIEKIDHILLPIGAGMFIYVALRKFIPELHKEMRIIPSFIQAIGIFIGIFLMYLTPTPI